MVGTPPDEQNEITEDKALGRGRNENMGHIRYCDLFLRSWQHGDIHRAFLTRVTITW